MIFYMKKVLYIGGFTMPDGNAAAQRVLGIGKLLRECGYLVRFTGLTKSGVTKENVIDGFQYKNYPYPNNLLLWMKYLTGYDFSIKEILKYKPDVVILYNHPALAIEKIKRFCHKRGIKILADITEWYKPLGSLFFKTIKNFDTNRRMTYSHKKLDGLICISSYLLNY